jgi:CRP/FNR family transcriptional regulator
MPVALQELYRIKSLSDLDQLQLDYLSHLMVLKKYAPGELIFLEGDKAEGIWFIVTGKVRIIKHSENGRIQGLCITSAGKCFGGCPLFDGKINPASAQALDEVTLLILPEDHHLELARRDPQLLQVLLRIFSQRLEHLARLGEGLGAWKVSTRINDCLATYMNPTTYRVDLTHEKLAELVGTAREVVTRHLSSLEKDKIIRLESGYLVVHQPERLKTGCLAEM